MSESTEITLARVKSDLLIAPVSSADEVRDLRRGSGGGDGDVSAVVRLGATCTRRGERARREKGGGGQLALVGCRLFCGVRAPLEAFAAREVDERELATLAWGRRAGRLVRLDLRVVDHDLQRQQRV